MDNHRPPLESGGKPGLLPPLVAPDERRVGPKRLVVAPGDVQPVGGLE